jgi:hypothetical protein
MGIILKSEITSSVHIPEPGRINIFYNDDLRSFGIKNHNNEIRIYKGSTTKVTASNVTNFGINFYSGSSQNNTVKTLQFFSLKYYGLTGSLNLSNNTITIDAGLIQYSASNIGTGLSIYSGSNNNTFNFFTITGTLNNTSVTLISGTLFVSTSLTASSGSSYSFTSDTFIQPDPTFFSSATFAPPEGTYNSSALPISGVVYLFGMFNDTGNPVGKILYATMSNPTSWSQTTNTNAIYLLDPYQQAIIGNKIYKFGGTTSGSINSGSLQIYTASVNNPLSWGYSGATLPGARARASIYVSKETGKIVFYGGRNQSDVGQNTIFTASISNPLVWGTAPTTLPATNSSFILIEAGDWIYLYGGSENTNAIWRAHKTTPTVVSDSGFTLTRSLSFGSQPVQIGNYVYILGNLLSNGTFKIDVNKPWAPEFISGAMSIPAANIYAAPVFMAQNKIFLMGGGAGNPLGKRRFVHTSSYFTTASTVIPSSSLYQNVPSLESETQTPTVFSKVEKFGASTIWQTDFDRY